LPKKNLSSVNTDKHVAPPSTYCLAILIGLKFFVKIPFEGLAFFISAIIEILLFLILFTIRDLKRDFLFLLKNKIFFFLSKIIFFFFVVNNFF
jgi:hypothetical protein